MPAPNDVTDAVNALVEILVQQRMNARSSPALISLQLPDGTTIPARTATPEQFKLYEANVWWPEHGKVVELIDRLVKFRVAQNINHRAGE